MPMQLQLQLLYYSTMLPASANTASANIASALGFSVEIISWFYSSKGTHARHAYSLLRVQHSQWIASLLYKQGLEYIKLQVPYAAYPCIQSTQLYSIIPTISSSKLTDHIIHHEDISSCYHSNVRHNMDGDGLKYQVELSVSRLYRSRGILGSKVGK